MSEQTKFTQGDWELMDPDDATGEDSMMIQTVNGGVVIAHVLGVNDFPCVDEEQHDIGALVNEMKANANLVVAAPDLYKTLDQLLNCSEIAKSGHCVQCEYKAAQALAKARGES